MAVDTIKFKVSDVSGNVPSVLAANEVGINLPDGRIFTPNGSGGIKELQGLPGAAGADGALNAVPLSGGTMTGQLNTTKVHLTGATGADGGEIEFAKPVSSSNIQNNMIMDINGDSLRLFENGNGFKGIKCNLMGQEDGMSEIFTTANTALMMSTASYTGSDPAETNYPIGTYLLLQNTVTADNNSIVTVKNDGNTKFRSDTGTLLSGTWRKRGHDTQTLVQRIA